MEGPMGAAATEAVADGPMPGAANEKVVGLTKQMGTGGDGVADVWAEYRVRVGADQVWQDLGRTKGGRILQTEWEGQRIWTWGESLLGQWVKASPTTRAILKTYSRMHKE